MSFASYEAYAPPHPNALPKSFPVPNGKIATGGFFFYHSGISPLLKYIEFIKHKKYEFFIFIIKSIKITSCNLLHLR